MLSLLLKTGSSSLTFWYPRNMLQLRVGLIESAATTAGAFSGLLAFSIEFMDGTQGLQAWSWIFVRQYQHTSRRNVV